MYLNTLVTLITGLVSLAATQTIDPSSVDQSTKGKTPCFRFSAFGESSESRLNPACRHMVHKPEELVPSPVSSDPGSLR